MAGTRRYGRPAGTSVRGDVLRRQRESRQLTRSELSDLAGITTRAIQTAEHGGPVSGYTLRRLCGALDLPAASVIRPSAAEVRERLALWGREAPPTPTPWVGRVTEVERLRGLIETVGPVCVTGPPGVGKTALAAHFAACVAANFDQGFVWIAASQGGRGLDAGGIQRELAEALRFVPPLPEPERCDSTTLAQAFRHNFDRERRFILLDGVVEEAFCDAFAPPGSSVCALLTTSLRHIADRYEPRILRLEGLPADEARALLAAHVGSERLDADAEGAGRLLARLGGLPGAIRVAGSALRQDVFVTPRAYVERLEPSPPGHGAQGGPLAACLNPEHLRLRGASLDLLASLAPLGERLFPLSVAAALGGVSEVDAAAVLGELRDVYLVREVPHAPEMRASLETYASQLAYDVGRPRLETSRQRLVGWVLAEAQRSMAQGPLGVWSSFRANRPLWEVALDACTPEGYEDMLPEEPARLSPCHPNGLEARLPALLMALEPLLCVFRVLDVVRRLPAAIAIAQAQEDRPVVARMLLAAGLLRSLSGDRFSAGLPWLEAACARALPSGDALTDASVCCAHGRVLVTLNRPEGATMLARALRISEEQRLSPMTIACLRNDLAIALTRSPASSSAWPEAVRSLDLAIDACPQDGATASGRVLTVLRSNRAVLEFVAGLDRQPVPRDQSFRDLLAIAEDEPLLRARLMAHAAGLGLSLACASPEALLAHASELWHEATVTCPESAAPRAAYLLGECAGYLLRWLTAEEDRSGWVAEGTGVHLLPIMASDPTLYGLTGIELSVVLVVPPLAQLLTPRNVRAAARLVADTLGEAHRCYTDLRGLMEHSGA